MTSTSEVEPILANQRRTVSAFLYTTFSAKAFIKQVQTELDAIANTLADDSQAGITINGKTFDDKTSQGALLAVTNFTQEKTSVSEGYNGLVSSLDNITQQIRQLVRG